MYMCMYMCMYVCMYVCIYLRKYLRTYAYIRILHAYYTYIQNIHPNLKLSNHHFPSGKAAAPPSDEAPREHTQDLGTHSVGLILAPFSYNCPLVLPG